MTAITPADSLIGAAYRPTFGDHATHIARIGERADLPHRNATYYWIVCSCGDAWVASEPSVLKAYNATPCYTDDANLVDAVEQLWLDGRLRTQVRNAVKRWRTSPYYVEYPRVPRPLTVGALRYIDDEIIVRYVHGLGAQGVSELRCALGPGRN